MKIRPSTQWFFMRFHVLFIVQLIAQHSDQGLLGRYLDTVLAADFGAGNTVRAFAPHVHRCVRYRDELLS